MTKDQTERSEFLYSYRGPLPPANMMAHYEESMPGMADRIVSMAESQQKSDNSYRYRMMVLAFSTVILAIAVVGVVLTVGAPIWVAALATLTPGALVVVGAITQLWRTRQKILMETESHALSMRIEAERHQLDSAIRRERHDIDMLEARQRLALPDARQSSDELRNLEAGETGHKDDAAQSDSP